MSTRDATIYRWLSYDEPDWRDHLWEISCARRVCRSLIYRRALPKPLWRAFDAQRRRQMRDWRLYRESQNLNRQQRRRAIPKSRKRKTGV